MIDSVGIPSEACKAKMGGKIHRRGEGENDGRVGTRWDLLFCPNQKSKTAIQEFLSPDRNVLARQNALNPAGSGYRFC